MNHVAMREWKAYQIYIKKGGKRDEGYEKMMHEKGYKEEKEKGREEES